MEFERENLSICMSIRRPEDYKMQGLTKDVPLVGLILYLSVNSYGHVEMVSSLNNTFSSASLTKQLTSISCTYVRL